MYRSSFIFVFFFIFLSFKVFSSSSSYLIANSALIFSDYEQANKYFGYYDSDELNKKDLNKRLLSYVIANSFDEAVKISKKILNFDNIHQEAWLVYLVDSKIKNLDEPFIEFNIIKKNSSLNLIDYIFYDNSKVRSNTEIAKSIIEVIDATRMSIDYQYEQQDFDYLLYYLSLSLVLDDNLNEAYFFSGQIYEELKNYKKAIMFFNKVDQKSPFFIESRISSINNIFLDKREKEAEQEFKKLLKMFPDNEIILASFGDYFRKSNKYEEAIFYYSKILSDLNTSEEKKSRLLYIRGICYEKLDNWNFAEKDFLQSLEINPESPQVLNYLAYSWIEKDSYLDKSLEMLKKAHEYDPENHYILDSLAWAYYKKNNYLKASELMEEVISRAPGEAISLDHLGDIYFSMGRQREALYMWKQAYDLATPEDEIIDSLKIKIVSNDAG